MARGNEILPKCLTCDVVDEYVRLANSFTQDLSEVLLGPMWAIFLSLAGLWIVIHGIKMILGKADLLGLAHEFVFVAIAAGLLSIQGPALVNNVYSASLSVMGGAAGTVLAGSKIATKTGVSSSTASGTEGVAGIGDAGGMRKLVFVAENGVTQVFGLATEMWKSVAWNSPLNALYALLLALPYFVLLIVYFCQVIVSIFRVMMIAALSPILMLLFAFGWGRNMAMTGIKTLFATFMVLFGSTVALAVCLYGVKTLAVGVHDPNAAAAMMSLNSPTLWVAIILGWVGTAFMAEATGMANSIANSQLTNQAASVITAGMAATGLAAINPNTYSKIRNGIGGWASSAGAVGLGAASAGRGAYDAWNDPGGLAGRAGQAAATNAAAQALMQRIKTPIFDRGDSK